jgi:hypothetical protein
MLTASREGIPMVFFLSPQQRKDTTLYFGLYDIVTRCAPYVSLSVKPFPTVSDKVKDNLTLTKNKLKPLRFQLVAVQESKM